MKKLYFLILIIFGIFTYAQETSLTLKTLHQVNTYNGGEILKTTFDNEQNNITVGYSNGPFTFGTENISTVNTNSLFILKSDNQTGEKIWLKKFTPDNKGSIKPYFSYTKNNQTYIVFNFRGILDINGSSYNSYDNDWMMMKIDQNGNVIWTSQLTIPIGFPSNSTSYKYYDMSIQNENAYILIANKIFHFKDTTGELISSFNNSNITLTSIEVTNQDLYFAGNSRINFDLGTESIKKNAGVILKSNLNFEVNAAIQFYPDSPTSTTNVSDLEISTDGTLNFIGTAFKEVKAYGENSLVMQCDYNKSNVSSNLFIGRISKDFTDMKWFAGNETGFYGYLNPNVKLYQLPNKHMALYFVRTSDIANVETISFFNNNYNGIVNGSILFQFDENGFASGNYNPFYGNKNTTFDFKSVTGTPNISEIFDGNLSVYGLKENYYFAKNFTKNVAGKKGIISSNAFKAMDDGSFYNGIVTQNNVSDYFGNNVSNLSDNSYTQMFSKISSTGNVEWKTGIKGIQMFPSNLYNFNKTNYIDTDGNITSLTRCSYDNNCILSKNNFSQTIPDSFGKVIITNIDNQGEVNWMKLTGINSDSYTVAEHNGYHYIFGLNQGLIEIDNIKYGIDDGYVHMNFFLIKIANNGEIKFVKQFFNNTDIYEANLSFDENDNIYGFIEPSGWFSENDSYQFDNVSVPSNAQQYDLLMVKFDPNGNPLFGKNFYENLPQDYSGGWFSDFRYNGNDFIAYGALIKNPDDTYYGVDGQIHSTPNDAGAINNFVTKISKQGDVIWETPIFSKTFNYSKIDIDNSSNIYVAGTWKEKFNIQNQNFNLSAVDMSVNLLKFDNQGNIKYTKELYTTPYIIGQVPSNLEITTLTNGKIVLAGNTLGNNLLNEDINNLNGDNYYIAVLEEEVLKTDEVNKISINIYPNPSSDFINIHTKEKFNNIEVYDATGRKVISEINSNNQIDVRKLLNGVYYIRIMTGPKSLTSKFIKN